MRHRFALILTVIGAVALPVVMAGTVLYASDAAISDAGAPLRPPVGAATQPATTQTHHQRHRTGQDDHGGATTRGGDDHGGSSGSSGDSSSGGSGSSGGSSGDGSGGSAGSGSSGSDGGSSGSGSSGGGSSGGGSSHGGDDGGGHGDD